ncbi:hypothetical protein BJ546DRAFT_842986 [Cryomyces antarcticus]
MLSTARSRFPALRRCLQLTPITPTRRYADGYPIPANDPNPKTPVQNVSATNALPTSSEGSFDKVLQESVQVAEERRTMQAPNRKGIWSRSQRPRSQAMTGPRFEQTIMEDQPRPYAAIELIHKQPVRWTDERKVACDGGGGPLGHPRIFINVDKPIICMCNYCGLPFANTHHRKTIEALPHTEYPLDPTSDPAEVPVSQSNTGRPLEQR